MTFKEYVHARRVTDTPAGDFIKDARSDNRLPDATSWPELKAYVDHVAGWSIRDDVVRAAYAVWRGYQVALRQKD